MAIPEKEVRLVRKNFENSTDKVQDRIRIGNRFVDDFIFDDHQAADIPINALRVIFNIISQISSEQFRPEDRPKQLSLFDDEFETDNNIFAAMKIRNSKISPSGSTKQVIEAYEFLAQFKMGWYRSVKSKGHELRTVGGLSYSPSYDQRGYTSFLISSYWLKKLLVIPEYNYVLYNLVYNILNNKHIIFAIWLSKLPDTGTSLKLETLNSKFGLHYKSANDFCFKFLKPAKASLDHFNTLSFRYHYRGNTIDIQPVLLSESLENNAAPHQKNKIQITRRLRYFKKRYRLTDWQMTQLSYQYSHIIQTRELIEKAFKRFIRDNRLQKIRSTENTGLDFLNKLQEYLILIYHETKMGELLPNGYPVIM